MVATDLGTTGTSAVAWGDELAVALGRPLLVAHVIDNGDSIAPLLPHLHRVVPDVNREAAAGVAVRHHVRRCSPRRADDFDVLLEMGTPDAALTRLSAELDAKVLVVGPSRKGPIERALLGSTARRIIRHATCPVFIARGVPNDGPVLVATDLTDPTLVAERSAAEYARKLDRELILVHALDVFRPLSAAFDPSATLDANTVESLRTAAKSLAESCLERVGAKGRTTIEVGNAARLVVEEANRENAALVVVSSHGREGLARLTHGSVAEQIVLDVTCSVLLTHRAPQ